ncbi:MAG: HD domain-containing protein, partial [Enterococcus sp.]
DLFIVQAAALLHDTVDDKVVTDPIKAHDELKEFLQSIGVEADRLQHILYIIDHLSFSKEIADGKQELSIEGQIVQDADRIDALGAIGILRTAYYGGSHGHPIYDPELKPKNYQTKEDYRTGSTVINHFYEKLFLLPEKMNTAYAKQEAKRRQAQMENFLSEFYSEWDGQ